MKRCRSGVFPGWQSFTKAFKNKFMFIHDRFMNDCYTVSCNNLDGKLVLKMDELAQQDHALRCNASGTLEARKYLVLHPKSSWQRHDSHAPLGRLRRCIRHILRGVEDRRGQMRTYHSKHPLGETCPSAYFAIAAAALITTRCISNGLEETCSVCATKCSRQCWWSSSLSSNFWYSGKTGIRRHFFRRYRPGEMMISRSDGECEQYTVPYALLHARIFRTLHLLAQELARAQNVSVCFIRCVVVICLPCSPQC